MASFTTAKNPHPLTRGEHAGLYSVRWRRTSRGKQAVGYLPDSLLLPAYTAYEHQCWADGVVPDAPEVRYAAQIEQLRGDRRERHDHAEAVAAAAESTVPSLLRWVGSRSYVGANRYDYTYGTFFECGKRRITSASRRENHIALVTAPEMEAAAQVPMDELSFDHYFEAFWRWLACPACVDRCRDAGMTPGSGSVPWTTLVPREGEEPWDGACSEHRTTNKRHTYLDYRQQLGAHFNATRSKAARRRGVTPLESPVPDASELFDGVIFRGSVEDGGDPNEELRYGLTAQQVTDLENASPRLFRAIPMIASVTLSRGGQELTGTRICDVSPDRPDAVSNYDPEIPVDGDIFVRNFRRRRRNGTYVNSLRGKSERARRGCPAGEVGMRRAIEHILEFRSTPDPNCPACAEGIGHWRYDDHANNPHVYDEDHGIRCPMAAEAPLWVDEKGDWLTDVHYTSNIWPLVCEQASLTERTLGWKPLPRHFRSTGTGLYMDRPDADIEVVIALGGWKDAEMIRDHYLRRNPQSRRDAMRQVERHHFGKHLDDADEIDRLRHELAATRGRLERAERLLRHHGIDATRTSLVRLPAQKSVSPLLDDDRLVAAIEHVVVAEGAGKNVLMEFLELAPAGQNYRRLDLAFGRLGLPPIPPHWAQMSQERQEPYRAGLVAAIAEWRAQGEGAPNPGCSAA